MMKTAQASMVQNIVDPTSVGPYPKQLPGSEPSGSTPLMVAVQNAHQAALGGGQTE